MGPDTQQPELIKTNILYERDQGYNVVVSTNVFLDLLYYDRIWFLNYNLCK